MGTKWQFWRRLLRFNRFFVSASPEILSFFIGREVTMKMFLALVMVPFLLAAGGMGCSPGSRLTSCYSHGGVLTCGVKLCDVQGHLQKVSSSSELFSHPTTCQSGSHSTTCFEVSTDDFFECSRRHCDPSTGFWESKATKIPVKKTKAVSFPKGWKLVSASRGWECIPGSITKECIMIDDGMLMCITQVCDLLGRWQEKSKEVFN